MTLVSRTTQRNNLLQKSKKVGTKEFIKSDLTDKAHKMVYQAQCLSREVNKMAGKFKLAIAIMEDG